METGTKQWRIVRSEQGPDYGIFRVRLTTAVSPRTGEEGRYVVLDSADFVNIIALTTTAHVVLVRQHRHGINDMALEIPSGLVDEGEAPLAAAQRELAEETGYTGERWLVLGRSRPNAAFMNNWCYHVLAEDVRHTAQLHLDPGEDIAVELVPLADIPRLIAEGTITQTLAISAFYAFEHWGQDEGRSD
jgi:8-oxo-dGTP pyrophosphatase MutT (NUDIX family)